MAEDEGVRRQEDYGLDRTLALSDGVFAFALTLLVLDLVVPVLSSGTTSMDLWKALSNEYISFLNFVLSFAIAGVWWNAHHRNFQHVRNTNIPLRLLNIVFLVWIALIPFFTKLLTQYHTLQLSVAMYAFDQAAAGFSLSILWYYASRNNDLIERGMTAKAIRFSMIRNAVVPVFFVASIGLAFVDAGVASFSWYLLFPIYLVINWFEQRKAKEIKKIKVPAVTSK
ncbi:MAG TPA: TMEM175 family protein [Candidatus Nanoarchaeia archaeon]|nr:TMEM175 family protein [Candidatus Nanoarchaeia archaeon]